MRLKSSYSSREVAALTGLSARQLRWWDANGIFSSAIASRKTSSGGFTERRYSPIDVLELLALADLRRRGFAPAQLKQLIATLRDYFRRRLSETLDEMGELRLLSDGKALFLRTRAGHVFDVLVDPYQPIIADGLPLKPVSGKARRKSQKAEGKRQKA
jgi:DNA-binding transcriptional MerR regulator